MAGDRPLVLGQSLINGEGANKPLVLLTRSFVPTSIEKANTGSLYTLDPDAETQTFYLLPDAPPGAEPAYFEGQLEDVSAGAAAAGAAAVGAGGADAECVAIFDEATGQWTLELLAYKLPTRLKRGEPPGAGLLARGGGGGGEGGGPEAGAQAAAAAAAAPEAGPQVQALPSAAFNGALDDALFGDDDGDGGEPATAAAAAAPPPPRRGVVIEDDGGGAGAGEPHACSEDESDGVGLDVF